MHRSFHGEKSIQGGGLSQIRYNLYFIYITVERLQALGSVEKNQREGIIYCTVGGRHDTGDSLHALRKMNTINSVDPAKVMFRQELLGWNFVLLSSSYFQ